MLAKQLSRAIQIERSQAEARTGRLEEQLAAVSQPSYGEDASRWKANQLGAVSDAEKVSGNGRAPPSAPAAMRSPTTSNNEMPNGYQHPAERLRRASVAPLIALPLRRSGPLGHATAVDDSHHDHARANTQRHTMQVDRLAPMPSDPRFERGNLHASHDLYQPIDERRQNRAAGPVLPPPTAHSRVPPSSSASSRDLWARPPLQAPCSQRRRLLATRCHRLPSVAGSPSNQQRSRGLPHAQPAATATSRTGLATARLAAKTARTAGTSTTCALTDRPAGAASAIACTRDSGRSVMRREGSI